MASAPTADRGAFGAVLVGHNSLVGACAERLQEQGHAVVGLVSPSPAIRRWAAARGVATGDRVADIADLLGWGAADHRFSITNMWLLPPDVLARCRGLAVNFHVGLLPLDAGVHASTWAVLQRAERHGITWHVMTGEADAGDILEQRSFDVAPGDTSSST